MTTCMTIGRAIIMKTYLSTEVSRVTELITVRGCLGVVYLHCVDITKVQFS